MKMLVAAAMLCGLFVVPAFAPAMAQAAECPSGHVIIYRVSKIKPGGTREGFTKAVADNLAWYRSHGMTSNIQVGGSVMTMDPTTHIPSLSPDEVVTLHIDPPSFSSANMPHDAAWDAFVAEYTANTDMVSQTFICLDNPVR